MFSKMKDRFLCELKTHSKIAKNLCYIIGLRGWQIVLGLVTTYFVAHALSKESFGEYQFILSSVGILTVFSLKGLNSSVMQAVSRGFPGSYRKAVPLSFLSSFIGSLVLAFMALWNYSQGNDPMAYGFAVVSLLFPFTHGLTQWKSVKVGSENFISFTVQNGLSIFVMYLLMIVAVHVFPGSFFWLLALVLGVPSIQNVFLTILDYKRIPLGAPAEDGNVVYGIKVTFYSSFNTVAMHMDKLLLFFFLSPAALAAYVAGDRISDLFRSFVQDTSDVLAPRFAKSGHYTEKLDRYIKLAVIVYGVAIVVFSFTLLPFFITFLFGANYSDSIPYAQALMCSVAVGNAAILKFRFIRSKIDIASFRTVMMITSLARIIMSVILIPWLGITGAVISVFIYRLFFALVVDAVIKKSYPVGGGLTAETVTYE